MCMLYYKKKNMVDTYKYSMTDIYNVNTAHASQSTFTYPHVDLLSPSHAHITIDCYS